MLALSKLVITLATRGRPAQLIDTINKSLANWREPNTMMTVAIDSDDQATIEHLNSAAPHAWFVGPDGPRIILDVRERPDTIARKWNRAMTIPADVYLVAADDDPYITAGYDSKILEAARLFDDGIGMVYGHMANLSFSCAVAPTVKLVEKMGYIQPEYFPYWFCDHWTDDLARMIGRIALADVRTDQSKAPFTQELREPAWWATWFDAAKLVRRKLAWSIIEGGDFLETPSAKERMRRMHYRVDYYSKWVNDNVRAQAGQLSARAGNLQPDARYLRVKQKAIDMVPQILDGMEAEEATAYLKALMPVPNTIASIPQAYPPAQAVA